MNTHHRIQTTIRREYPKMEQRAYGTSKNGNFLTLRIWPCGYVRICGKYVRICGEYIKIYFGIRHLGGREDRRAYRTSKNGGKSQKISPLKNWPNMSEYVRICQNMREYVWGRIRCLYSTCIPTYSDSWCVFSVFQNVFVVYSDDVCEATCILMYLDVFRHVFRNPREYALEYRRIRTASCSSRIHTKYTTNTRRNTYCSQTEPL